MTTSTPTTIALKFTAVWLVLTGCALWFAPASAVMRIRGITFDALRPGLLFSQSVQRHWQDWQQSRLDAHIARLDAQLHDLQSAQQQQQERVQRLTAQLATANELITTNADENTVEENVPRLFTPALLDAAVLGETLSQTWRTGRVIDGGWRKGLREHAVVLASRRPLIDLGQAQQLSPEDTLLIGRTVLGKIETVGRWTSTFIPITDTDFRGRAQLVRQTEQGPAWGAQGLIRGTGNGCQLDGIAAEETVRAGDLVYTAERDGVLSAPLVYGTVINAELDADGRAWTIEIQPAPTPSTLGNVQVLRAALNPARLWAN
jgi:cell shape-determining protein MreC